MELAADDDARSQELAVSGFLVRGKEDTASFLVLLWQVVMDIL